MKSVLASDSSHMAGPSHRESSHTVDFGGQNRCATQPITTLQYSVPYTPLVVCSPTTLAGLSKRPGPLVSIESATLVSRSQTHSRLLCTVTFITARAIPSFAKSSRPLDVGRLHNSYGQQTATTTITNGESSSRGGMETTKSR